jgi:hypothetical protein
MLVRIVLLLAVVIALVSAYRVAVNDTDDEHRVVWIAIGVTAVLIILLVASGDPNALSEAITF